MTRPLALLAILALAACARTPDLETLRTFDQASARFAKAETQADYLEAAALFESSADGFVNGAVYYNLGNAYAKAGEPGRAVAAYRRALRDRPRDPFLKANLDSVLASLSAPRAETGSLVTTVLFWQDWISYSNKARWLLVCWGGVLAVSLLGRCTGRRKWTRRIAFATSVPALLLALSLALDVREFEFTEHGVLVGEETVARKGDAESYEPAFNEPLTPGTEFVLVDRRGSWLNIRLGGKLEGWIPERAAVVY